MWKKLVTGILSLALCASTLAALPPRTACAGEPDPTPVVLIEPVDPTPPVEPGEPGISPNCSEFPEDGPDLIIE